MDLKITENEYGRLVRILAVNLQKNGERVPGCVKDAAVAFEQIQWQKFESSEKRTRLQKVVEATGADGGIEKYFEDYPHPYSKKLYQRYLVAQAAYQEALAAG